MERGLWINIYLLLYIFTFLPDFNPLKDKFIKLKPKTKRKTTKPKKTQKEKYKTKK